MGSLSLLTWLTKQTKKVVYKKQQRNKVKIVLLFIKKTLTHTLKIIHEKYHTLNRHGRVSGVVLFFLFLYVERKFKGQKVYNKIEKERKET